MKLLETPWRTRLVVLISVAALLALSVVTIIIEGQRGFNIVVGGAAVAAASGGWMAAYYAYPRLHHDETERGYR